MKRGSQVLSFYQLFVFSFLIFLSLFSNFAIAQGYFPDLNTNLDFRKVVIESLTQRARHFIYQEGNESHQYIIRYGEDYESIRRFFDNPLRDKIRQRFQNSEAQSMELFKELAEKITYIPLNTDTELTIQYETFIHRPRNTPEHGVTLAENEEIPYVEGTFLEAISTKPHLVTKPATEHPEFQGPYFTFTLTEIPKEYLSTQAQLKAFPKVRSLIRQFIRDTKSGSESLSSMKNLIFTKDRERALLIERFTDLYRDRAHERANAIALNSSHPESTFLQNYAVGWSDLTSNQVEQLTELDKVRVAARIAYTRLYAREVTTKLTPKYLVPYLVRNLDNSDVVPISDLANLPKTGDEDSIPDYYAVYAISKVGQEVFDFMKRNELY